LHGKTNAQLGARAEAQYARKSDCSPQTIEKRYSTPMIAVGGKTKEQLLLELRDAGVQFNRYAEVLFADPRFTTSRQIREARIVVATPRSLGFPNGVTSAEFFASAIKAGLELCPLEFAAHYRLQYRHQPAGPYLHIASLKIDNDESFPRGFYLRNIEDTLWLRGYIASDDWAHEPDNEFVFLKA
jgi:hypothetical protein